MVDTHKKCFVPACGEVATVADPMVGDGCRVHIERWLESHSRARARSQVVDFVNQVDAEMRNGDKAEAKK